MKKKLMMLVLAMSSAVWAGDYEDGEAAQNAGRYTEAMTKFKSAAEQGNAKAQYQIGYIYNHEIGYMYNDGEGIVKNENEAEALKWFTKAAEQDYKMAQEAIDSIKMMLKLGAGA